MAGAMPGRNGGKRKMNADINVVPYIDVMLVLLIIFMVTAPLITTGIVDLPSVGKSKSRPEHFVEIVVGADDQLKMRVDGKDSAPLRLTDLAARVAEVQGGNAATPVVISADRNVKYETVVKAMDVLQRAGVQRVGLSVKQAAP